MFEVSQFDNYSYLFNGASIVNIDGTPVSTAFDLTSLRIGLNGKESVQGQAYSNIDLSITSGQNLTEPMIISPLGTIIGLEKGASQDEFFLTFEKIGEHTNVTVPGVFTTPDEVAATTETAHIGALDPNSIAWITAERVHEEGGTFVLSNAPIAMRMGQINELAEKTGSQVIAADATSEEDLENLVKQSMEILGGKIDFVLHSIGMSINVRKGRAYTDQKYDWTQKGTDVSAMSFHKVMQTLYKNDAMNEWGSIVALTYMYRPNLFARREWR